MLVSHQPEAQQQALAVDAARLAELLGLCVRTVRQMDAAGKLPRPVRFGHAVRWSVREIEGWLAAGRPIEPRGRVSNDRTRNRPPCGGRGDKTPAVGTRLPAAVKLEPLGGRACARPNVYQTIGICNSGERFRAASSGTPIWYAACPMAVRSVRVRRLRRCTPTRSAASN